MRNEWSLGLAADLYSVECDKATPLSSATRSSALHFWIIISPRGWGCWFSLAALPRQNIRGQLCTSLANGSARFARMLFSAGGYLCRIYYLSVTNSNAMNTCINTSQSMRTLSCLWSAQAQRLFIPRESQVHCCPLDCFAQSCYCWLWHHDAHCTAWPVSEYK